MSLIVARYFTLSLVIISFVVVSSCLSDEASLSNLPKAPTLNEVVIIDSLRVGSSINDGAVKGTIDVGLNNVKIDWSGDGLDDFFPFRESPSKTYIHRSGGVTSYVETALAGGAIIRDSFQYDEDGRVTRAKRTHEGDGYEFIATFYYGALFERKPDSISLLLQTVFGWYQGFFKKIDTDLYISIFPFDPDLPYTLEDTGFDSEGVLPSMPSANYYNTWRHSIVGTSKPFVNDAGSGELRTVVRTAVDDTEKFIQCEVVNTISDVFGVRLIGNDWIVDKYEDPEVWITKNSYELESGKCIAPSLSLYLLFPEYFEQGLVINQVFSQLELQLEEPVTRRPNVSYTMRLNYTWK